MENINAYHWDIYRLVARGYTNQEIARRLNTTPLAIQQALVRIYYALGYSDADLKKVNIRVVAAIEYERHRNEHPQPKPKLRRGRPQGAGNDDTGSSETGGQNSCGAASETCRTDTGSGAGGRECA